VKTFIKFLKLQPEEVKYIIGRTTAQLVVENNSPVMERVDKKFHRALLQNYLTEYYSWMSYMKNDEAYSTTVKSIMQNQEGKEIWGKLAVQNYQKIPLDDRIVVEFDLLGFKIPLHYSSVPLNSNNRFEIVEFTTENKILDFLPKLL
jgi:hypothetical protein